jgi:probable FeS assembly SUF system protein SufT
MYEEVNIRREVGAIQIPDGSPVVIPEGTKVLITQSLGGSFTVMTDRGAMYRIDERNADALGKEPAENVSESAAPADAESLEQLIWSEMKKCFDPEIPVNIVDLGLIYDCQIQDRPEDGFRVEIKMTLTAPGCGMGPVLADDVRARLEAISGIEETEVEIVFDPPWNPNMMTDAARLQLGFM